MTLRTKPTILANDWASDYSNGVANIYGTIDLQQPSDASIALGDQDARITGTGPVRSAHNWLANWLTKGQSYLMQRGIPEWDSAETYAVDSVVSMPTDPNLNGWLWLCVATPAVGTAPLSTTTTTTTWVPITPTQVSTWSSWLYYAIGARVVDFTVGGDRSIVYKCVANVYTLHGGTSVLAPHNDIYNPKTGTGHWLPEGTNITAFTASGTWNAPGGVYAVELLGCGGGGGGGGGGNSAGASYASGGGGGGGGSAIMRAINVVPFTAYSVTVGAGGTLGAAGSSGANGSTGGDGGVTTFGSIFSTMGGSGGSGGSNATNAFSPPGGPGVFGTHYFTGSTTAPIMRPGAQSGGFGCSVADNDIYTRSSTNGANDTTGGVNNSVGGSAGCGCPGPLYPSSGGVAATAPNGSQTAPVGYGAGGCGGTGGKTGVAAQAGTNGNAGVLYVIFTV